MKTFFFFKWGSCLLSNHVKDEENSSWERWSVIVSWKIKCCVKYAPFGPLLIFPYQMTWCWKIDGECLQWNKSPSSEFGSWWTVKRKIIGLQTVFACLSVLFLSPPRRWNECLLHPVVCGAVGGLWGWSSNPGRLCVICASSTSVIELLNQRAIIFFKDFIRERHTQREAETEAEGEEGSRDSIPGPRDHTLSPRQTLNHWATQASQRAIIFKEDSKEHPKSSSSVYLHWSLARTTLSLFLCLCFFRSLLLPPFPSPLPPTEAFTLYLPGHFIFQIFCSTIPTLECTRNANILTTKQQLLKYFCIPQIIKTANTCIVLFSRTLEK